MFFSNIFLRLLLAPSSFGWFRGDMAELLLELGREGDSREVDAVGPEAPTATELFTELATAVGSRALVRAPGVSSKWRGGGGCMAYPAW